MNPRELPRENSSSFTILEQPLYIGSSSSGHKPTSRCCNPPGAGWLMGTSSLRLLCTGYVVHGLRGGPDLAKYGHLLPSIRAIANKTEAVYMRIWEQVRIHCPYAQPQSMLLDFEKAAINSFQQFWPHTVVKCCSFHLTQNICRKVQVVGLQAHYIHDEDLPCVSGRYPHIPFDVNELFNYVAVLLPPTAKAAELLDYFQRTYVGRTLPSGYYSEPKFPIAL